MFCIKFSHISLQSKNVIFLNILHSKDIISFFFFFSLTQQLNALFTNTVSKYSTKEEAFNAIGTFCCSFASSYNSWYRAQVLNWELVSVSL